MIPVKRVMFEEDLHEIFFKYPYLIIKQTEIITVAHEYTLDSNSIVDLYIETSSLKVYCEIKLRTLRERDYYQAKRYYNTIINNTEKLSGKRFSIILIGMSISDALKKKAELNGIFIFIIGIDIPESIKICEICRKAYNSKFDSCIHCNSDQVLEIMKLKYP